MIMPDNCKDDNNILPVSGGDKQHSGVTILELRFSSCRYVVGQDEDDGTLFCGEVIHRVSYCRTHYRACYRPVNKIITA